MARTSLELNATVTGVQSIQQLSSALNESKERMKEFANMSEYDKLTQEAANFRNLQNEIAKYNQTMAQSAQGGSYTANAFMADRILFMQTQRPPMRQKAWNRGFLT